jgi:hypothetical protein
MWNIFLFFLFWRLLRAIFGFAIQLLTLVPIFAIHLYRLSNRQALLAHRSRDASPDTVLAWLLILSLLGLALFVPEASIRFGSLLVVIALLGFLFSGTFRPLGLFFSQKIPFAAPESIKVYTIRTIRDEDGNKQKALYFVRQLLERCPELILSLEADAAGIYWRLIDPLQGTREQVIQGLIQSVYPKATVEITGLDEWPSYPAHQRCSFFLAQRKAFPLPIQDIQRLLEFDPLMVLSQMINELESGERVAISLALGGLAWMAKREGQRQISQSAESFLMLLSGHGARQHLMRLLEGTDRVPRQKDFDIPLIDTKLHSSMYYGSLWVQIQSPAPHRSNYLLELLQSAMKSLSYHPYNPLEVYAQIQGKVSETDADLIHFYQAWRTGQGRFIPPTLVLNHEEIASLWHLPHAEFVAARIQRIPHWQPLSEEMATAHEGNILGQARYHHQWLKAHLELEMRRLHVNLVGKTGVGKSTFLFHQIAQDILNGYGVAVIDPHGSLVEDLLRSGILLKRAKDVVLIDLNDSNYPAPLNPFALRQTPDEVLRVIAIIESLFEGTEQQVQTASFLRAALQLLSQQTDVTMKDIAYLFLDKEYRSQMLATCQDDDVKLYLEKQYDKGSGAHQAQIANSILNRVRPFYSNPHLYPMVCHPNCLNFAELMAKDKIILVSLNTNTEKVPPQERHLLGTLIMSQLQQTGMRRQRKNPYFIYVDEVQHFVTTSLNVIFAEARKNGLALTTANQYLGQLQNHSKEAMLGNAGTNIVFRLGPEDVSTLAAHTKPEFTEHDLLNLNAYTAAVKTQFQKSTQPAFSLRTLPMPTIPENGQAIAQSIRQLSRRQYSPMSRSEIMEWLKARYQRSLDDEKTVLFD